METLHNLTTGEQSGGQEHHQPESPQRGPEPKSPSQPLQQKQTGSTKAHGAPQQPKQSRRHNPERKRLRHQRQSTDSDAVLEHKQEAAKKSTAAKEPSSTDVSIQAKPKAQEDNPKQKRERKPQRPGKYVCTYCGRPCAKPSVLQKHIRSHTGERPYPCAPCGFSFKTKSNLYKHRKSHTHRVKAGLALGEPKSLEEQVTESEDETRQLSSASSITDRQSSAASAKSHETDRAKDCSGGSSDSYAVKKRLALRLSRGKHTPQDSSNEKTSSLILDSRGSTESGYFSRSESTEQSQDSPPNTSAKSYAEIILGKYGRLGHLQRMSRHHNQHPPGQEEKNISFTVPKKQVIDHITKLITINEAVVDTSKIDSVKPRRFSLSRKNSSESQKGSNTKEALIHSPNAGDLGYKSTGSISMGVPCEKFQHPPVNVKQPVGRIPTGPLMRSHSLPSAGSSFDASGRGICKFRLSQSFDERQPSEMQTSRRYGTLRRQPAIEIPLGAEHTKEEQEVSLSFYPDSVTTGPDLTKPLPQPYECEACGIGCKDWEGYKKHKQSLCLAHPPQNEVVVSQMECSQRSNHAVRAGASTIRKRRKEESFEFDEPSSPPLPFSAISSGQFEDESSIAPEGPRRPALQTCSVIQHTSSFEKQESLFHENQGLEASKNSPPREDYQLVSGKQPQHQLTKPPSRKLVRQNNVKVPEILVTEDFSPETSAEPTSKAKNSEKPDEFQWPQRSPSLAQLPIEKLPPKKKRLRLAEATQSSGESSFDSMSLPRSPSQDSSASYASSRSTSFEEPNRSDMEVTTSTPLRRSRAPHMLTVPGEHQHREMRRSASEQAPHDPQPSVLMAETRSKSFDYSCLSPERSAVGWRERRKCLLMRHAAIRDQDEEEEHCAFLRRSPEHLGPSRSSQSSPSSSPSPASRPLISTAGSQCKESFSRWKLSQNIQLTDPVTHDASVGVKKETLYIHPLQPNPKYGPSGAARAHYLPMSTGLKLEIPSRCDGYSSPIQHSVPHITSSLEILTPLSSPTVAVRHQTDTLTPACAIYTTLSQSTSPMPQEALDAVSPNIGMSAAEYSNRRSMSPDLQLWFDNGLRSSGSGGNKRMLSPSNSMELHPELQQLQKRVKEEEDEQKEAGCPDTATAEVLKRVIPTCFPVAGSPVANVETSYPSLLCSTCNSWCYLNYIKPNPSALDEQKPSVYSSWSTSSYDPNPPGLSSKTVLSLLHCKQRLSPSIYTTSPMSVRTAESMEQEDSRRPCSSEVYSSPPHCRDHERMEKGHQPPDSNGSDTTEKEEKKNQQEEEEEVRSLSRKEQSPERRSNTLSDAGHGEDERNCRCEGSRFHRSSASEPTEPPPRSCDRCKAAGRFAEQLRSEAPESEARCHSEDTHEGVFKERSVHPDQRHDGQSSAPGKGTAQEDDDEDGDGRLTSAGGEEARPSGGSSFPDSPRKSSAGARRALFARRRLNASESLSRRPPSPCTGPEPSPPHSPSSRPHRSPAPPPALPTPPTRQASADSPVPGLSSAPPGCPADVSAHCPPCPHLTGRASAARPLTDDVGLTHVTWQPSRPQGSSNLLSHLPLHSQQPSRAASLLIPIGGIHMIQPRSPLPLYRLVCSPSASSGKMRPAVPPLQDALREASPSPETPKQIPVGDPSPRRDQEGFSARQQSGPETKHPDSPARERHVYVETTQGQKKAPSSQTQL